MPVSEHFLHTKPSIGKRFVFMLRKGSDFSEESIEKSWGKELANESSSKFIPCFNIPSLSSSSHVIASPEFVNMFVRIGFGSTIKLVSLDESQVVTFNGEFFCDFRNGDCSTGSWSDNMVGSPYGFIIHWIIISKNIKEVTKIIDAENLRIDNSRVLRVRPDSGNGSTSSELEARVCIKGRICLGQFARKLYGDFEKREC
ncbi:hypothetical protein Tco_0439075 [Tanacetum coccineum]